MRPLTAQRAVTDLGRRVQDISGRTWGADEVLDAAEETMESIFVAYVQAGRDHELDALTIATADLTSTADGISEYVLPEWVGAVRRVEATNGQILRPFDVDQVELNQMHDFRGFWDRGFPIWVRGIFGKLRLVGRTAGFDSYTIWFQRRSAPQHYGAAREATAGPSTTQFRFAASPTAGTVVQRDDIYVGMQVEFSSGNVDFLSRITDYDGATQEATLEAAAPAPIATSDTYSTVIPIPQEHRDYFKSMTAVRLLEDKGQDAHIEVMAPRLSRLEDRFFSGLRIRDNTAPRKIHSRRR